DIHAIASIRSRLSILRRNFDPEIVHIHSLLPHAFFALTAFANHDSALLVSRHSASVGGGKAGDYALPRRVLGSARWIACCSRDVLRETCREVPEIAARCSVIYNGLSDPGQEPGDLVMDPPHLVCVGRLVRQKGFDVALEAFARVADEFRGARLTIGGDGPERDSLASQAESLGIGSSTGFPGWIPPSAVPSLIDTASVVLVPSRDEEGFGLVALQAAQMARPVVASGIGGLTEVVVDGETGVLVEPDDPGAIAREVSRLVRDPERAAEMGRSGRVRARREFGGDRFVAQYIALYGRLLTDRGAAGEASGEGNP
ncbi:MAG: glycosyltransferase family 4 protein, partial [Gemmatimonadota bacterium]